MEKKEVIVLFICLILLVLLETVIASFTVGKPVSDIETTYARDANLRGWINISLEDESVNSLLTANINGQINILDFLDENDADYDCNPSTCESSYSAQSGTSAESKQASLTNGEEKTYVFLISGDYEDIYNLSFSISSTAGKSCTNPLKIDLGEESIDWKFDSSSNDFSCFVDDGCYEDDKGFASEYHLTTTPFCEKINLKEGSKFELGAWVKKGSGTPELKMQIYDLDGDKLEDEGGECILPSADASELGGLINCKVNFSSSGQDYYVCIASTSATDWKIKNESHDPCGSVGFPFQENIDFYVYAKNAKFNELSSLDIRDEDIQNNDYESFSELIEEYINDNYDNDCTSGCYIPIKFISGATQTLTINNIVLAYNAGARRSNFLYDAVEKQATIDMDFEKLDLKYSNLTVTGAYGDKVLKLYLGGDLIDSETIEITKMAEVEDISPTTVAAGVETKFVLEVSNKTQIESYEWDFGDDTEDTTSTNYVTHTYTEVDDYELTVKIIDEDDNENTKSFTISVISPKNLIPELLQNKKRDLRKLQNATNNLPTWIRNYIYSQIDLDDLNKSLSDIEEQYEEAEDEEEYIEVMLNLNKISMPKDFIKSESASSIFIPEQDNIDLENLQIAGAGAYDEGYSSQYKEAIVGWFIENVDANYNYKVYSFIYSDRNEPILTSFSLTLEPTEEIHLVLEDSPVLKQDYDEETHTGFYSLTIDSKETLEFLYPGKVLLEEKVYSSSEFRKLNLGVEPLEPGKAWGWILLFLIILFVFAFIAYIILQQWYKRNYENSIFKNRNDLFNLQNFIKNAFARGMQNKEIISKLKKAGWKREQIIYAINKVKGKSLGMFEIPIFDIFSKKKAQAKIRENLNNTSNLMR